MVGVVSRRYRDTMASAKRVCYNLSTVLDPDVRVGVIAHEYQLLKTGPNFHTMGD